MRFDLRYLSGMKYWLVRHREDITRIVPFVYSIVFLGLFNVLHIYRLISSNWTFVFLGGSVVIMLGYAALLLYINRVSYRHYEEQYLRTQLDELKIKIASLQRQVTELELARSISQN
jgi:hypothetical protein